MAELLLELFSEEIPARMQAKACQDLQKLVTDALAKEGLFYEDAKTFVTPRRLTLVVTGLPEMTKAGSEERRGPREDAPQTALDGFLKSTGLTVDQLEKRSSDKGTFYYATMKKEGQLASKVIADFLPDIIENFPWPKSMRWGTGTLRWVRPLHNILCILSAPHTETQIVPVEVGGLKANNITYGHRFMAPDVITVSNFDDYADKLKKAYVVLDPDDRRRQIFHDAQNQCFTAGFSFVEDRGLLEEVAGLVEWPVVLMGKVDEVFQDLPPEVLKTSMRTHQKFFSVKNDKTGKIVRFITVANVQPSDGGVRILDGNQRVLSARLSDAKYFWQVDLKSKLEDRLKPLEQVTYHAQLGSQAERIGRIAILARELSSVLGTDAGLAERSSWLSKCDLLTEMVGEFPELQGIMGRYYALMQGESESVASAIEEHYKPQGPSDSVPTKSVSMAVAIADKLDQLAGFWAIDEKPTGSKDPYALRRAALGVIRIILENKIRFHLKPVLQSAVMRTSIWAQLIANPSLSALARPILAPLLCKGKSPEVIMNEIKSIGAIDDLTFSSHLSEIVDDLMNFFADRLKVYLREEGISHDLISAVYALGGQDDFVQLVDRATDLKEFLDTGEGQNLLSAYRRAVNILRIEEKKDGVHYDSPVDDHKLQQAEEKVLHQAIADTGVKVKSALAMEDFRKAMELMAGLRPAIDAFFENVTVNSDDSAVRINRLRMLNQIRLFVHRVADFSKIES